MAPGDIFDDKVTKRADASTLDVIRRVKAALPAMQAVCPRNVVARHMKPNNCVEVSSYSKSWPCFFPQHGRGKKHQRPIRLEAWQWIQVEDHPKPFLRGMIHSDGCRFMNTGRKGWRNPRYSFCNVSTDIRSIFCEACDLLGLAWTYAKPKTLYVSRKADVARMDEFIGPKT